MDASVIFILRAPLTLGIALLFG